MALETLEAIRTRRVAKYYDQNKSVSDDLLWTILEAARWAPTGGNERVHHFICLTEKSLIKKIKKCLSIKFNNTFPKFFRSCI